MQTERKIWLAVLGFVFFWSTPVSAQEEQWYKGNTHTHTNYSDGNEYPRRVVRWYLDHNYNFLVLTDHNKLTATRYLDSDPNDDFILIPGEEVTNSFQKTPAHVCGLGMKSETRPQEKGSLVETLQSHIDGIRQAGGIAQINHPNWKWAFDHRTLGALQNYRLFEVYNAGADCNNFGAGGRPGMEEIWDRVLSGGLSIFGVASDDTHEYLAEFLPMQPGPGRGWVMVRARELSAAAIVAAMDRGDFYASTGVVLKDVRITPQEYALAIEPLGDTAYTTQFIGAEGKVLKQDFSLTPSYRLQGTERYVRARVESSNRELAWTQPVFPGGSRASSR